MFCCFRNSVNCSIIYKLRLYSNKSIHSSIHKINTNLVHHKSTIGLNLKKLFLKKELGLIKGSVITSGVSLVSYIVWRNTKTAKCNIDEDIDEFIAKSDNQKTPSLSKLSEDFDYSKLWQFIKPDSFYLIVAVTSALIVAILNIQIPISLGSVMNVLSRFASEDNFIWDNNFFSEIKTPALKLLELYTLQSIFTFVYISSLAFVGERTASRIRNKLFSSVIRFDISFFDSHKSGEIISILTNDVQDFKSSFKLCVSQGLRSITQIIGCSISLFVISPSLTLWMSSVIPLMVLSGAYFGSFLRDMSKEAQSQVAKASGVACEAINNVRTVKAFAMEEIQTDSYNREVVLAENLNCNLGVGIGVLQGLTNFALNGIVLGTLLFGGYLLSKEEISAGNLMSFLVATQTIQKSLSQLSLLFGHYVRGITAATRIFSYMDIEPSIESKPGVQLSAMVGEVCFNNVTFSYPTRSDHPVLNNFNIILRPGTVTAICGLSGEGKSTIASLLELFYNINSGSITLDGIDIRELDHSWLRGNVIGFINQEPVLFGTTVLENIRFGKPEATDDEVYRAAKIANAHNFIENFPEGYHTLVGERGVTVSGGQKQRIAIARAVIKNPLILILDEATSALDSESEAQVQEALEKVMKNRTVLVIAHRLSTIQNADMIAVISKGKIVESGTHSELRKIKGFYWKLIKQQFDLNETID